MSEIYVVYDGECPFCSEYVKLLRLRAALGKVTLVNAREADNPIVKLVEGRGIVLDEQMALVMGNEIYGGAECINRLALMSTPSTFFNRVNAALFSSPFVAKISYPILRFGRLVALRLLGRRLMAR